MAAVETFALCDVVATEIRVNSGTTYTFATADEIKCEPVIEEGETKALKIKEQIIAKKEVPDMVTGHDITCKDNVFSPKLVADLQGGSVVDGGSSVQFTKYTAPVTGAIKNAKTFDFIVYVEIVGDDGPTGDYLKYIFPNCKGSFISPNFKDGEYYASEYSIKSRPALGVALYTVELVNELPSSLTRFVHPALATLQDEEE